MLRNHAKEICSLASFLIVSLRSFINKPDSSRNSTIFMMPSIPSFEIRRTPNPKVFLCIHASAADPATVNPNGIKILLANGLSTFFIKGQQVFSNGPRRVPRNLSDCTILDS